MHKTTQGAGEPRPKTTAARSAHPTSEGATPSAWFLPGTAGILPALSSWKKRTVPPNQDARTAVRPSHSLPQRPSRLCGAQSDLGESRNQGMRSQEEPRYRAFLPRHGGSKNAENPARREGMAPGERVFPFPLVHVPRSLFQRTQKPNFAPPRRRGRRGVIK